MKNLQKYLFPFSIFLTTFAAYIYTAAPSVTFGDSGELITAAYGLGIPHPPGFPLWVILTKIFITITPFFGSIAHRTNISSGFYMSVSLVILYFIIKEILEAKKNLWLNFVSAIVPIFLGFTFSIWQQSIVTEVYSLNLLLCLIPLYILLRWYRLRSIRSDRSDTGKSDGVKKDGHDSDNLLYLFAFTFGLSLTNHYYPIVLALPYAIFIVIAYPAIFKNIPKLAAMFIIFCLPLLLYLFLPFRSASNPILDWGNTQNLDNFFRHLRREQYHGGDTNVGVYMPTNQMFSLSLLEKMKIGGGVVIYVLFKELSFFSLLIIPGFILLLLKKRKIFYLLFLASFFSSFVFALITEAPFYKIQDTFPAYSPAILMLAPFVSVSLSLLPWLVIKLFQKLGQTNFDFARYISLFILVLVPIFFFVSNFHSSNWRNNFVSHDHAENLIKDAPKKSIIVSSSDKWLFPLLYILKVENQRPDIDFYDRRGVMIPYAYDIPREMFHKTQKEFDDYVKELDTKLIKNEEKRPVFFAISGTCTGGYETQGILGKAEVVEVFDLAKKDSKDEKIDFAESYQNILNLEPKKIVDDFDTRFIVSWYHANYASQLFYQGKKEEALKEIRLAQEIAQDNFYSLNQIAFCLTVFEKETEANQIYLKIAEMRPDKALFRYNAGVIYEAKGDLAKAEEEYAAVLALNDPTIKLKAQKTLILFYLKQFKWQEAQNIIDKILDKTPNTDDPLIYLWQGSALNNLGEIDQAIISLEKARELGLHNSQVYEFLGIIYLRKGDKKNAKKNFETALEIDPKNETAKKALEDLER